LWPAPQKGIRTDRGFVHKVFGLTLKERMAIMGTRSWWKGNNLVTFDDLYNTARAKQGLWADCPLAAIAQDPSIATVIFEDFTNVDAATLAGYTATKATTGTFALDPTQANGVALADCGATTQHQGINVQKLGNSILPAAGKDIWFEARVKVVDLIANIQMFVGLAGTDTTLMPNGAIDSTNSEYIGILIPTAGAGVMTLAAAKATAADTAAYAAIVEDTWTNIGFKVNGVTDIKSFLNGVVQADTILTASLPVTDILTPTFVCQSDGTSDPILHIDWYKCVQLR